jgi:hypothetical protein
MLKKAIQQGRRRTYYTRPPQTRQDALLPVGYVEDVGHARTQLGTSMRLGAHGAGRE